MEELVKVLHADPLAAPDSFGRLEVAESNLYAVHRPVMEDQQVNQCRQKKQVQHPVAGNFAEVLLPRWCVKTVFCSYRQCVLRRLQLNHILTLHLSNGFQFSFFALYA